MIQWSLTLFMSMNIKMTNKFITTTSICVIVHELKYLVIFT